MHAESATPTVARRMANGVEHFQVMRRDGSTCCRGLAARLCASCTKHVAMLKAAGMFAPSALRRVENTLPRRHQISSLASAQRERVRATRNDASSSRVHNHLRTSSTSPC